MTPLGAIISNRKRGEMLPQRAVLVFSNGLAVSIPQEEVEKYIEEMRVRGYLIVG